MVKEIKAKLLKRKKRQEAPQAFDGSSLDSFSAINISESYVSLITGILVVLVVATAGVIFLKQKYALPEPTQQEISSEKIQEIDKTVNEEQKYIIAYGDDLKSISLKFYGTPDYSEEIAKANNIENVDFIEVGSEIKIPKIETSFTGEKITGDSYVVGENEYLWDIAVKAYGDGFRWVDIAKANNIQLPEVLTPGMVLVIPR